MSRLRLVCDKYGITMEYTAPNTPQQNGVVERKFVTIRDRSSAMTYNANWSATQEGKLWAESISTSETLTNIVANSKNVQSPDELFFGTKPTLYKHLVQYGRVGYVAIRTKIKKKLAPKAS